jgi:hypothetical protein
MTFEVAQVVTTDAGMAALWQPEHFAQVTGLSVWEREVAEPAALRGHIAAGALVPLNVGGDGTFQIVVRRGGGLTDRERRYVLVSSPPYQLVSRGAVALGGLQDVGGPGFEVPLDAGRYPVVVHLVDWGAEPGARNPDGTPAAHALADFVVEVQEPAGAEPAFRTSEETFERP